MLLLVFHFHAQLSPPLLALLLRLGSCVAPVELVVDQARFEQSCDLGPCCALVHALAQAAVGVAASGGEANVDGEFGKVFALGAVKGIATRASPLQSYELIDFLINVKKMLQLNAALGFAGFCWKHPSYPSDPFDPPLKKMSHFSSALRLPGRTAGTLVGIGNRCSKLVSKNRSKAVGQSGGSRRLSAPK